MNPDLPSLDPSQPTAPDPASPWLPPRPADQVSSETTPEAPGEPEAVSEPAASNSAAIAAGDLVRHRTFDPYIGAGGEDVERVALVLEVTDGAALVAFLPVSGPVPLDELEPGLA